MSVPIPVNLVVEDSLSEAVVSKLLSDSGLAFRIGTRYIGRQGNGYIKNGILGFNRAARATPFFILTDLDDKSCAPSLIVDWLGEPASKNLIFRVAVREVEAWLLAHRAGFASFLGINRELVPTDVESLLDPKRTLINLARKSKRSDLRKSIVPPEGSHRRQGPDYN